MTPWLTDLTAGVARRWRDIDPALPAPVALATDLGDRILTADSGPSRAAGVIRTQEFAPTDFLACFAALRHHSMRVHLDGPDPGAALAVLFDKWRAELAEEPVVGECAAGLAWPSRDTAPVSTLLRFGFVPAAVIAIRATVVADPTHTFNLPHASSPTHTSDATDARGTASPTSIAHEARADDAYTIRPARPKDLDVVVELQLDALRFDERVGTCTVRESTPRTLRERLEPALRADAGTHLLAWVDGEPVGLAIVTLPPEAGWIAGMARAGNPGYVECLSVRPDARGRGVGRALVRAVHDRLREASADAVLLHHALANPLSTPFWNSQGYRPLWTQWQARPGTPLFPAAA